MSFHPVSEDDLARARVDEQWAREGIFELEPAPDQPLGGVDKAWHGLAYLLESARTGVGLLFDAEPLDTDGHLFGWSTELVAHAAERLGTVTFDQLAAHYDPERMDAASIYPGFWARDPDDGREYLEDNLVELKKIFAYAADHRSCLVQHLG
ncbi:YfbM family protein [Nocardia sp. SSK8]|uniref:YfbM family protein n=1 Tax=Nocardia sp. SSK8 TaxID=3120154 RepID=UPI003009B35E